LVALTHFCGLYDFGLLNGRPENSVFGFEPWIAKSPLNLFVQGNTMVQVFFVLSGFVLVKSFAENSTFLGTLTRRYVRLAFPVLMACLIAWSVNTLGLNFAPQVMALTKSSWLNGVHFYIPQPDFGEVFSQGLYQAFFIPPADSWMLGGILWTMRVEFSSSVMLIIFVLFLKNRKVDPYAILLFFTLISWGYYQFFVLCGTWLYLLKEKGFLKDSLSWRVFLPLSFFAVLYSSYPNESAPVFYRVFSFHEIRFIDFSYSNPLGFHACDRVALFHGFGAFLFLFLTVQSPFLQKFLGNFVFLGKISFPVYLLHLPLLFLTGGIFLYVKTKPDMWSVLFAGIVFAYAILFCAWLMYLAVEKPVVSWSKRIGRLVDDFAKAP